MANVPVIINRDVSVFFGNTVRASRQLQTPRITDINGGNDPLLMANNVVTMNDDASEPGHDGGICVARYQPINDTGAGDVVADTPPADTGTSQTHSGLNNSQIKLDAANSAVDDFYNKWFIKITSGLHIDQVREVLDYEGATRVATMTSPWTPIVITGTVSTSATSTTVTGLGTLFTTELAVGDTIIIGNETKEIFSITNDVTLDAVTPYNSTNINISCTLPHPSGGVTFDLYNRRFTCLFWDESAKKWQLVFSVCEADDTITIIEFADLCMGALELTDLKVSGVLQVDTIEPCTPLGPITFTENIHAPGISFDSGANVLDTYLNWAPQTVTSLLPFLNTVTADAGTFCEQIGDKVTLKVNIFFAHSVVLPFEFSGLFLVTGAPPAAVGGICSNATLVSELPFPLTSRSAMISMIPGTSIIFLRVVGGSLPIATHRILGELIYRT